MGKIAVSIEIITVAVAAAKAVKLVVVTEQAGNRNRIYSSI